MKSHTQTSFSTAGREGAKGRRRDKRHTTDVVTCPLGEVVDISASGMRVAGRGMAPLSTGGTAKLKLHFPGGKLAVAVEVVWRKRKGLLRYEMGLRFTDLTPSKRAALAALAEFGFIPRQNAARHATGPSAVAATIDLPDHYQTLGLTASATTDEIKAAFRRLAKRYHPDMSDDPSGSAQFKKVHVAYEVLRDPEHRKAYDEARAMASY